MDSIASKFVGQFPGQLNPKHGILNLLGIPKYLIQREVANLAIKIWNHPYLGNNADSIIALRWQMIMNLNAKK